MEFLRKLSFSSTKSDTNGSLNSYHLEERDHDKFEELNKNFTHRDAEIFAPQLVKDMKWEKFNERILDYGCGTGKTGFNYILPPIYLHDSHLYSIDTQETMISYATMKYPHPTVSYTIGDIMNDNFPFKYIQFDKIFSLNVLQCIRDCRAALGKLSEALKPGGYLGFTMATNYYVEFLDRNYSTDEKWHEYFEDWIEKSPLINEYSDRRTESFQHTIHGILENVGFEILKIRTESLEWNFPSLEKAVNLYMSTSPYVKSIPAELQEPFEEDTLELMMKQFGLNSISDPFEAKYDCIYVVAKKPGNVATKPTLKPNKHRTRLSLP